MSAYLIEHLVEVFPGDGLSSGLGHGAIQGSLHALRGMQGRLQGNALPYRGPLLGLDLLLPPPGSRHLLCTHSHESTMPIIQLHCGSCIASMRLCTFECKCSLCPLCKDILVGCDGISKYPILLIAM